ncbi:MAG: NHLP bacteriocin export ABC transporter permease/ATPase subunit [Coriobacteriia bacterium]|nr:NHLP bacteriocin export ABC transporter permease/ATPase subunit [Coriobacteriia bacterium]
MNWFESQINERRDRDLEMFDRAMRDLSAAVTGRDAAAVDDDARMSHNAILAVLAYYGVRPLEAPPEMTDLRQVAEYHLRPSGIRFRTVRLPKGWYKDAVGPLVALDKDEKPVALLPGRCGGYTYTDPNTGKKVRVDAKTAQNISNEAWCFYRPFPQEKMGPKDILMFMMRCLETADYLFIAAATLVVTLLGTILPRVNQIVFGPVVKSGNTEIVAAVACLLICVTFAQLLITAAKDMLITRVGTKLSVSVEAAAMMRMLSLPASFFKHYTAGDLSMRLSAVNSIAQVIQSVVLSTALTSLFSLCYIAQIFTIAPALALPAFIVIATNCVVGIITALLQVKVSLQKLEYTAELQGWLFTLIGGIQKIKVAGAERRAFSTWAQRHQKLARLTYNGPLMLRLSGTIQTLVSALGTMLIYYCAVDGDVTTAQYMAFSSAFGMVSGAFTALTGAANQLASIQPFLKMAEPLLQTKPEISQNKEVLRNISGGFEMENVTFSYKEGQPPILNGLSLKVEPGEYVAVVGRTGCGKSTLMRMLLGFEEPQRGAVYYDKRDLSSVDIPSLRRNIGVVLQDGKLFQGDIYSNIAISTPGLTMDEAWEAAKLAGIDDDIRAMPMGMHTQMGEGGTGLSGGQRQRLMIARAIACKPKILMFDEATSALDNVTQRIVCESLDKLECTRLVIAHRLSTIRTCNRILVLDQGKIAEDGTYDELVELGGIFAELVERQQA